MMRQIIAIVVMISFALIGCSASPSKTLIRNDLAGKPLTADDFTVIVGNKIVKTFYPKDQLKALFPDAVRKENDIWQWSVLDDSGPMSLKNVEYKTKNLRFVYIEEDINEYAGLDRGVFTIRGIGIGDSAKDVLDKYGASYFGNEKGASFLTEENGLIYRLYNYPESLKTKYPLYDYIHFETRKGKVVGIHFWRKCSDAP